MPVRFPKMKKLIAISVAMLCLGCNPEPKLTIKQIQGSYVKPGCPIITIRNNIISVNGEAINFKLQRIKGNDYLSSSRRIIANFDKSCHIFIKEEPIYQPIRMVKGNLYLDIGANEYTSTVPFEKQ
jgi:hypothetical protein